MKTNRFQPRIEALEARDTPAIFNLHAALPTNGGYFPFPADRTGDVRNLDGGPSGQDSPWIDLDAPAVANDISLEQGAVSEVFGPYDADGDRVPRFNAIELLVQRVNDLQFYLSADINPPAGPAFRNLKAIGDMNEKLRTAGTVLRRNLAADHFEGTRRLGDAHSPSNRDAGNPPVIGAVASSSSGIGVRRP